ncbi:MAG: hypothetical protein JSS02_15925 [Planctomycetes bacterium]|nr:hypothetical protein [Planctomycetota bacterium]
MFSEEDPDYVVAVLIDTSESFQDLMTEQGEAFKYVMSLSDRYFRQRIGTDDQFILAQVSDDPDTTFLWQGTPMQLRRQFPNPQAFSAFLKSKANPGQSHLHESIVTTVDYMLAQSSVQSRKAVSALFILSDMVDRGPDSDQSRTKAVESLRRLRESRGTFGCYFISASVFQTWLRALKDAGIDYQIAPGFKQPPMPTFD